MFIPNMQNTTFNIWLYGVSLHILAYYKSSCSNTRQISDVVVVIVCAVLSSRQLIADLLQTTDITDGLDQHVRLPCIDCCVNSLAVRVLDIGFVTMAIYCTCVQLTAKFKHMLSSAQAYDINSLISKLLYSSITDAFNLHDRLYVISWFVTRLCASQIMIMICYIICCHWCMQC